MAVCQVMDQQLDTMLYHTGRYSSLLAKRLQGQGASAAAQAAAEEEPADQVRLPSALHLW